MTALELDLGQPAGLPGYRLQTLEIYNWGTFHGRVWQLRPDGGTTLLTGPNGAGKTTVVDALVTLLTPPAHRHYNQSSGAEAKRDRLLNSYLHGAYGTSRDADTGDVAPQQLRPGAGYYSWLAATFWHEERGQAVTLVQYYRFRQGEPVAHFLVVPRMLSLQDDAVLQRLLGGEPTGWRAHLQPGTFKEYPSFEQYAADWQATLGVRSEKALTLFGKTVGMKMLGNLTDFVRREMLSDAGGELAFRELYEAYRHLLEVYYLLQKTSHQFRLLQPVVDVGREFRQAQAGQASNAAALQALPAIFAHRRLQVLRRTLAQRELEAADALATQQALASTLEQLRPRLGELEAAARNSDIGQQLARVHDQLAQARTEYRRRRQRFEEYQQLASTAGLPAPASAPEFAATRQQASSQQAAAEAAEQRQEEVLAKHLQAQEQVQRQYDQTQHDLTALRQQRSLIPAEMLGLRQRLCAALDLSPAQVPFVGELLQVRPEAAAWRPAIELLLHDLGLRLLVPDQLASRVSRYVHGTDLRARLVYHRVAADSTQVRGELSPDSLLGKVEVADKPPFHNWLATHLYQRYDYCCTDDLARYDAGAMPRVLTSTGLRRDRNRHEKDDRPNRQGARHYVLGWDQEEKIAALEGELASLHEQAQHLTHAIAQARQEKAELRQRQQSLALLSHVVSFEEIDHANALTWQQQLEQHQRELEYRRDHDEALREAQRQLGAARAEETKLLAQKTDVDQLLGARQSECKRLRIDIDLAEAAHPAQAAPPVPPDLWSAPPPDPATLAEADAQRHEADTRLRREQTELSTVLQRHSGRLTSRMGQFRRPDALPDTYAAQWQAECAHLLTSPESLGDYELLHQRLRDENLPRYEQQFQRQLAGDVLQFVFRFRRKLDTHLQDVKTSLRELNEALAQIDFGRQPRTYIRLLASDVRDGATQGIAAFRARLRQALPNQEVLATGDPPQALTTFALLQELLDELNRDDAMRRKVLDVRNWLTFGAEEVSRATDQVVNVYADSGGRSGGEKAKLAYTVLAAAIAYQYGAMQRGRHQPSFRFVVIDETFSKSDAANSTYALKLFEQLGLQLMIVTPLDNIRLAEPFIQHLHLVRRLPTFESEVWNLTLEQYRQRLTTEPASVPAAKALPASA